MATAFVLLSPTEQWTLFAYYLPHEVRTLDELLSHRRGISDLDRSLPQRAGRAFEKMLRIKKVLPRYLEWAGAQPRIKKNAKKFNWVFSEVKPDLDPAAFARILVAAALEEARKEQDEKRAA